MRWLQRLPRLCQSLQRLWRVRRMRLLLVVGSLPRLLAPVHRVTDRRAHSKRDICSESLRRRRFSYRDNSSSGTPSKSSRLLKNAVCDRISGCLRWWQKDKGVINGVAGARSTIFLSHILHSRQTLSRCRENFRDAESDCMPLPSAQRTIPQGRVRDVGSCASRPPSSSTRKVLRCVCA